MKVVLILKHTCFKLLPSFDRNNPPWWKDTQLKEHYHKFSDAKKVQLDQLLKHNFGTSSEIPQC